MFCPWCKSSNIVELQPTVNIGHDDQNEPLHRFKASDNDITIKNTLFNFQCKDCDTKFSVDHN